MSQVYNPPFQDSLPFGNTRYRHYDLAAKFLRTEHLNRVGDTKKIYLDEFVRSFRGRRQASADQRAAKCRQVLDEAYKIFRKSDPLLRRVGTITVYYHLIRLALAAGVVHEINRDMLEKFESAREDNREIAEINIGEARYDWLEFDRLNQTPNDEYAIDIRLTIMLEFLSAEYSLEIPRSHTTSD